MLENISLRLTGSHCFQSQYKFLHRVMLDIINNPNYETLKKSGFRKSKCAEADNSSVLSNTADTVV